MAVVSDGRNVDTMIANMFITTVMVGTSFRGVFVPFQVYRYFLG